MVSAFASQNLILMMAALLQLFLVFNILLLFGSSSLTMMIVVGNNETDRFALLELKKQIYDDPYGALNSWNDSIHFCNWVRITCGHRHRQRVISLDLQGKSLGRNISPSIGNLTFLHSLDIGNNSFHGKIPQEIGNLIRLQYIVFQNNTLQGELPTSLANCTRLREIRFSLNSLVGKIPGELFTSLSKLEVISINYNGLTGELPATFGNISSIRRISSSDNELQGSIPETFGQLTNLFFLALALNKLCGTIPENLTRLKGLQDLDLSHNNFSGQIPKELEKLSALQSLNLSFNNLEGGVPTKGIFKNASAIFANGNGKLCGGIVELHLPACTNHGSTKREKFNAFRIVLGIIGVVLGFILISSFLILYWRRRSKSKPPSTTLIGERFLKLSYKDLFQTTGGFSSANFIGSGSFGSVYKGVINQDETIVAVKVLNLQIPRVEKSFMAECKALRNIQHRNLVKILTSCSSIDLKGKDFKALVYEFMPNGSLVDWLHLPMEAHNHSRNLNLLQRLNIAIDVASALDYLHYNCYAPIVQCDLKPTNVLLDRDMTAHVSDFGLTRLLLEHDDNSSETQTSTIGIRGSIGYAAPEYGMGGRATIQGDVFSYGILLLEMFTGKRPTDQMFTDDLNLHNFAKVALPVHVMQILDPTFLPREEKSEEIEKIATNRIEGPSHRTDQLQDCITSIIEIAI
ncbi:probable LRR receptor-like serine/threonine-protein kinase At3g47570 [Telopea speciosissima]|uniref:probable LRR receptor-like serine/threonine-protein kinase At3g47570 n=1 Tax=Telopea speciosissima TaxID=54955 RepID=UPI001CC60ED6|nr:probable LRR receptor-like serine/threonine-protein kinase At3g47570 [Telopea speciosissima]